MLRCEDMYRCLSVLLFIFTAAMLACEHSDADDILLENQDDPIPAAEVELTPFTHPTWSEDPSEIISLVSSGELPIEWGPQGLPMAVLGVHVEPYLSFPVDIRASVTLDEVVASVYYKEKWLLADGGSGNYFNLFMITTGYKDYPDIPGTLKMTISTPDGTVLGEVNTTVKFLSP